MRVNDIVASIAIAGLVFWFSFAAMRVASEPDAVGRALAHEIGQYGVVH